MGQNRDTSKEMRKIMGKSYRVKCTRFDEAGRGIVKFNGTEFAVSGVLPGEKVFIELVYTKGGTFAKLVKIDEPSPLRVEPPCKLAGRCGGCQLMHLPYEKQLTFKQNMVEELFTGHKTEQIIGMENPYNYRNKIHVTLKSERNGKILSGIYEENTHKIIQMDECMIQDKCSVSIINTIKKLMKKYKLIPYNEDTGRGIIRHIMFRKGFSTGEVMVVIVSGNKVFPNKTAFCDELVAAHKEITTVVLNYNTSKTSMVLGNEQTVLYGKGIITDDLCGIRFKISAKSFYQINPVQTEKLYNTALTLADIGPDDNVLDAYCGIGTISLVAAKKAKSVTGVELNSAAVKDAKSNAESNNIKNASFVCADAGEYMVKNKGSFDVVIMDPPRSGSSRQFLNALLETEPEKIVYISCNPVTQKRDIEMLAGKYEIKKIVPVDLFPNTGHVETVVLLSNERNQHYNVSVKVDVDARYQKAKKVTYKQIQDYVREKFDYFAHSSYIAEVKRECGLEVHEAYNAVENSVRVSHCPDERKEQIREALKYFGVI